MDYFGLRKTKIPADSEKMTLITPNTFGLQVEVVYGENAVLDAEEYSMSKAGFDQVKHLQSENIVQVTTFIRYIGNFQKN